MSGEHPNTETPATDANVDAAETEVTLTPEEESGVTNLYSDWDGELESLESQPFYTDIEKMSPDQLREALKSGYEKVRNNATSALHAKATKLTHTIKQYDAVSGELQEKANAFSERLAQFQAATNANAEGDGVSKEALDALKAGLETQVSDFKTKLEESQKQAGKYFADNKELIQGYQRLKWEKEQLQTHHSAQVQALQTNLNTKIAELQRERDAYKGEYDKARKSAADQEFDAAFPYLREDTARRDEAQAMYQNALKAHLAQLPQGEYYSDERWALLERITKAQVEAIYPQKNAPAKPLPTAEAITRPPNNTQQSRKTWTNTRRDEGGII